jgi:hypothetical protein
VLTVLLTENLQATIQLELSLPFSAEAKNEWSCAASFSIRIQGLHKHNFIFTLTAPLKIQYIESGKLENAWEKKINGNNMSAGKFMGRNYTDTFLWIDVYSYASQRGKNWGDLSCKTGSV